MRKELCYEYSNQTSKLSEKCVTEDHAYHAKLIFLSLSSDSRTSQLQWFICLLRPCLGRTTCVVGVAEIHLNSFDY